ncbi:reverse transcriptase domain-containing protein [Tanacetum coccineum]|uniref:Reverse transcriptase domain-containing protein n=1 Tax=Tanacetum coccineum TaxID=301880 RepID=A0ABQ5C8B2_9ASTR
MGPFLVFTEGYKYILVASRLFVKWVEAESVPSNDAESFANFLNLSSPGFGCYPCTHKLIADNPFFVMDQFATVMQKYRVTHRLSTAYHTHTSGQGSIKSWLEIILKGTIGENRAPGRTNLDNAYGPSAQLTNTQRVYSLQACVWPKQRGSLTPDQKPLFSTLVIESSSLIPRLKIFSGKLNHVGMALSPSLGICRTTMLSFLSQRAKFQSEWSSRQALLWRERTTLGSSRSPNFPQGSINPCDGSSIATLNKRFVGGTPCLSVVDCPDCEDSQFCHSSRVSHPQLHLGNPIS